MEDDHAVRELVVRVLERAGYQVLQAGDAEGARDRLENTEERVDLLLTDVILPDTIGTELATELQEDWPGLAVLYMSGYTDDAIVHHGVLQEGTDYIEKPFRPRELLEKVWEVLPRGGDDAPGPGPR